MSHLISVACRASEKIFLNSKSVTLAVLLVGKLYEKISKSGVTTHKNYIHAGGRVVAIRENVGSAVTMKYLHQDHLGSTDAVTGDRARFWSGNRSMPLARGAWRTPGVPR